MRMSVTQENPGALGQMQARSTADLHEPRLAIRNLDFYYGSNKALKAINLDLPERQVTGMIGPSGCGKSTLLRCLNRMYDLYPGQRAEGEVMLDGENILSPIRRHQRPAQPDRHGVPEADAVSDVDLRQHRLRCPAAREARPGRDGRAGRMVADARRAVGRGEGPAEDLGDGIVWRPAAAPLHRPHDRGAPRGDPARRADLARSTRSARSRSRS